MFVNEEYSNYKYVVAVSDNYVVLSNKKNISATWDNPSTIDVVYQYFKPSFVSIPGTRSFNTSQTFEQIEVSSNFVDRADFCDIFTCCMLFICVIVFTVINCITKLVHRGGALYGQ